MARGKSFNLQREEHKETRDSIDKLAGEMRDVARGITRVLSTLDAHLTKEPSSGGGRHEWLMFGVMASLMFGLTTPMWLQLQEMRKEGAIRDLAMSKDDERERQDTGFLREARAHIEENRRNATRNESDIEKSRDWQISHDLRVVEKNTGQSQRLRALERQVFKE